MLVTLHTIKAQAPQTIGYQAVIRSAANMLIANTTVGMRISIMQTSANGTAVYVERQTPVTNINGLATVQIGSGTLLSGSIATIDWSNGPYFIKTETDPAGGTSYTVVNTSQFLSVPFALCAKPVGSAGGDFAGSTYPNPVVAKLNTVPVPAAADGDFLKILRYNFNGTQQWELRHPIEPYESIAPGFINIMGDPGFGVPPKLTRGEDDAILIPLCYGSYNSDNNTLSGKTNNVTLTRINTGIYLLTIDPLSIGTGRTFEPVIVASTSNSLSVMVSAHRAGANTIGINCWKYTSLINAELSDQPFTFTVYNR